MWSPSFSVSQTTLIASSDTHFDLSSLSDRAAALVEAATRAGADASDAVVAISRSTGVEVRNGKTEGTESAENAAFTLRAFIGQRAASISANSTSDLTALAERCVAMAKVAPQDPYAGLAPIDRLANAVPDLDLYDSTEPAFETMKDLALACEDAALAVEGVSKSSGASFGRSVGGTVLATSNGFTGSYRASRFSLSVSAIAGEGAAMERDYCFDARRHFADLRDAVAVGKEAGKRASKRICPKIMDTGSATVVFEPRMARGLVSHLAGATNASSVARKTSFLREDLGNTIFRDNVSIIDEPHLMRGVASRPFDAEGVLPQDLLLVENGVLQNWLLDGPTARQLGTTTNGRANRAGSGTSPGSTNLTLLAGSRTPEEMIADIDHGILVTELIGQGVNLITGDYSRGASGFLIENGETTHPVSEITIAGNLRGMFARLIPADDLEKDYGTNAPTIAIEGMTVAGR